MGMITNSEISSYSHKEELLLHYFARFAWSLTPSAGAVDTAHTVDGAIRPASTNQSINV